MKETRISSQKVKKYDYRKRKKEKNLSLETRRKRRSVIDETN